MTKKTKDFLGKAFLHNNIKAVGHRPYGMKIECHKHKSVLLDNV